MQGLESMVAAGLASESSPTPERIRELINQVRGIPIFAGVDAEAAEMLAKTFESRLGVTMTIGAVIQEPDFKPWLREASRGITPYYWERYRRLLIEKGFPNQVLAVLDDVTDRILGLMQNPALDGPWDRRGMVVGHVQSGKTANYTGLIAKAADAGYRVIIVIAGIHNNLRNQTQLRIDEGFVGRDSARLLSRKDERFIGVGRFDNTRRPVTFTNSVRDFNKQTATGVGIPLQNLKEPAIFVIKKYSSTLKHLREWLREHSVRSGSKTIDAPMLLIDDEADNASINISKGKGEVSKINGQIRDLLKMFERSCYVGYTATPFANIFIDPDTDDEMLGADLFPKNFIVSLDPPSNYFGPNQVFVHSPGEVIRHIDDNEDTLPVRHKQHLQVTSLPESLLEAVRAFVIARAIRLVRGHAGAHCSMLVNASRFNEVQKQIRNHIHERLKSIQASVRIYGAQPWSNAAQDPELVALHDVWAREFRESEPDWDRVQGELHEAVAPVIVVEVNSKSSGTLNYADHVDTGLSVIAVGGFSLSRGLTLEGLMVSYFLRNSMMYDTLMQMGRWFGYRPDYEDLCRVWMPEEAEGWYAHIAESTELLRAELRSMEAANATPEDFGLKVRSHPDSLLITARNKMGSGEKLVVSIGLGNSFVETAILKRDPHSLARNWRAVEALAARMGDAGRSVESADRVGSGWLIRDVPVAPILHFIEEFENHEGSLLTDGDPIRRYIDERSESELAKWDVLFASLAQDDSQVVDARVGRPIIYQTRTSGTRSGDHTLHITNKQRVASRGVERTGVDPEAAAQAEQAYREDLKRDGRSPEPGESINYPDYIYRAVRTRPLLIIHLLEIRPNPTDAFVYPKPVVAWSMSFPKSATVEKRVSYVVNRTWLRENYRDDLAAEEMHGDED